MVIVILSRAIKQDEIDYNTVITFDLRLENSGCTELLIYQNKNSPSLITIISNWSNLEQPVKFLVSENYNIIKNRLSIVTDADHEILIHKGNWKYSKINSKYFSISRTYVKNFESNLRSFHNIFTNDIASGLGILGFSLYTPQSNDNILIAVIEWQNEEAMLAYPKLDPTIGNPDFGPHETDRYGLMYLLEKWDTNSESDIPNKS
ncbi:MAG: hypothetical protein GPJ54_04330 [Candidatus Heimdallarchaeota archaeon]|nr:hypothetical protein [Candidatus Heimdallarchaeota archaeon]